MRVCGPFLALLLFASPLLAKNPEPRTPPPGAWSVTFANGVREGCLVRDDGVTVYEPARSAKGTIEVNGNAFVLAYEDDRTEKWTRIGDRFVVEHWFPASTTYPTGTPVLGIADRLGDNDDRGNALVSLIQTGASFTLKDGIAVTFEGNQLRDDAYLSGLEKVTDLTALRLLETNATGESLKELRGLKNFTHLEVQGTFSATGLKEIGTLARLKRLRFRSTGFEANGVLQNLRELKELEQLTLDGCELNDDGLAHLTKMSKLEQLDLSGTALSDGGVAYLAKLPKLKKLNAKNTNLTDDGVKKLQQALPGVVVERSPRP